MNYLHSSKIDSQVLQFSNFQIIMTSHIPKTQKSWTVQGQDGFESLKLNEHASVPEVSDYEVLVKFHATSLNYRDLIIPKGVLCLCLIVL